MRAPARSEQSLRQGRLGTSEEPGGGLEVSEPAPEAKRDQLWMATEVGHLSSGHMQILDFNFDGGTENVTKWHSNLFPGLIRGAFCAIFASLARFQGVLGPSLAGKRPKTDQHFHLDFLVSY